MRAAYLDERTVRRLARRARSESAWLPFAVALETGLRIGDVLALQRVNVRPDRVDFIAAKTGKVGSAAISSATSRALIESARGTRWCFPSVRKKGHHLTRQAAWYRVKAACKRAGIDSRGISPHSYRKTFAARALKQTRDIELVRALLQHEKLSDTCLYAFSPHWTGKD
jgi:integrase